MADQPGLRRKRQIGRPLGDLVVPTLGKTLAARGFAAADVVLAWPQIMGERLAGVCEPIELQWPRAAKTSEAGIARKPATLVIRVEGGFGLEIQHMTPLILERVNAYFGWRCTDKLTIRQGRVSRTATTKARLPRPGAEAIEKGQKSAMGIADGALREALAGLGAEIFARDVRGAKSASEAKDGAAARDRDSISASKPN